MNQNGVIKNLVIALSVAAAPVAAMGVNFSINGQNSFPVQGAVHYHTGTGVIEFESSDDRFFCFDFGNGDAKTRLSVKDETGVVLLNGVGLSSALQYQLGNNRLRFQSSNATPCFFTNGSGTFGLFGNPSDRSTDDGAEPVDCDLDDNATEKPQCYQILGDKFQGFPELVIEYSGGFSLDSGQLLIGDLISYSVTIRNDGKVPMLRGAFQELSEFGLLKTTALQCTPEANCGAPVEDVNGTIRYEHLSLDAKDGEVNEVTLQITKEVSQPLGLDIGTEIEFFSGVVSGDGNSSNPVFDSRVTKLPIIE